MTQRMKRGKHEKAIPKIGLKDIENNRDTSFLNRKVIHIINGWTRLKRCDNEKPRLDSHVKKKKRKRTLNLKLVWFDGGSKSIVPFMNIEPES